MDNYIVARDRFKPSGRIRFLLIAESPPASGGYFYFDRTKGKSSLFSETMKALNWFPEDKPMPKDFDKVPLLRKFQSQGFFMIDVSYKPVDKGFTPKQKEDHIKKEIPRLIDEIRKLDPESIIIVKVTLFNIVKEALIEAGLGDRILNKEGLAFPATGNQKKYRDGLRKLLLGKISTG